MFFESFEKDLHFEGYVENRNKLLELIKKTHPQIDNGLLVLFGNFENSEHLFVQESSFFYVTGVNEPGVALMSDMDGLSKLFIPNCYEERAKWCSNCLTPSKQKVVHLGLESIEVLGEKIHGYSMAPYFPKGAYENFLELLRMKVKDGGKLFVLNPKDSSSYVHQRLLLSRIQEFAPEITDECLIDISPLVATLRRKKSIFDVEKISDAIDLTVVGHEAAAKAIEGETLESEVRAAVNYVFTAAGGSPAFPSVVATGKNATVLHYTGDKSTALADGQLVIVDIGARFNHYCADITRTYPVSGKFTTRQREIYSLVLEAQKYIAELAKPGYFLLNQENEEKSLHHLAKKFFKERGCDQYFTHGIGHFLGLDVHDAGDITKPLGEGDVITIEPGLYIPEEEIGVRIEDNYWITKDKAVCLSEVLPKEIEDIEQFVSSPDDFSMLDEEYN